MRRKLRPIPRPVRACLWAALVLAELVLIYIGLGCPTLSMKQELRRAERANLVGPSKIVDTLIKDISYYDKLIVGETDYGICFLTQSFVTGSTMLSTQITGASYDFYYREKTGDLTIASIPVWALHGDSLPSGENTTVYLFDNYPEAQWAELWLQIDGNLESDADVLQIFQQTVERTTEGHFRFVLTGKSKIQCDALEYLARNTSGMDFPAVGCTMLATVKLYDANNQLILEREMDLTVN